MIISLGEAQSVDQTSILPAGEAMEEGSRLSQYLKVVPQYVVSCLTPSKVIDAGGFSVFCIPAWLGVGLVLWLIWPSGGRK